MDRLTKTGPIMSAWFMRDNAPIATLHMTEIETQRVLDRLAAYEDTGLTPEQVKTAIRIAERVATADYPHNFQRERRDIVDYMNWITDVMRDAKAWWNERIKDKGET